MTVPMCNSSSSTFYIIMITLLSCSFVFLKRHLSCGLQVSISHDVETSASAVTTCVAEACRKAIKAATTEVLQPVMSLEVAVEDRDVGGVLTDISSERRGRVREVEMKSELERNVVAEVPLATMIGYASALRSVTSGRGNFSMEFSHYALVTTSELETIKAQQAQTD
eukprot:m.15367 g.15367  ORF g.15367 m.15367 type:complete len:167 (-) comp6589_c0_seq1:77-577(-)